MRKFSLFLTIVFCLNMSAEAQYDFLFFKKKKKPETKAAVPPTGDKAPDLSKGPKPYLAVITKKAKTTNGFFKVHKLDNKFYFEIPDSLLGRDLLVVNRIAKSAAESRKGFMGYAGDQIGENVIRFEKGPSDRIFIKSVSFAERSQDTLGMHFAVQNSNIMPIMASFDVKAYKKDSVSKKQNSVIEVTDFVNSDNSLLFFGDWVKKSLSLGNIFPDRSYIDTINAFPLNLEIRAVKTYAQKPQPGTDIAGDPLTYELNSSIILLPKVPMKPRYFDPRVAYFTSNYTDFDKNPQGVEQVSMITRWRLEPKTEDIEKYNRGELVEPQKPIVFYIDPATPKKWVPYLIQGVNDWQKAFEKAGFKNAIYALEAPKDSTWNIDDARHSAIVYKPSSIANASGPHVHDPRSGEILETHINWYHNIMDLLHNWYFIQTAAVDTAARKVQFSDELMGQLIRFVSSHEVGHTLGLRHNMGSSSTIPVEKLRDKAWVEANGHTPSIMDYARFNYVAQPEDNIGRAGLFPRIGVYDDWSIQWGYQWLPQYKTPQDEVPALNKQVINQLAKDKRYTFGTETDPNDPRNQSEDLGDNAMLASRYGIKNLQRILPHILEWTKEPDKDYRQAREMYNELVGQFSRYMGHVVRNIGGKYSTPKYVEQAEVVTEFVTQAKQKEAMAFLNQQLFITPTWLINKELIQKAEVNSIVSIGSIQNYIINRLLNKTTFGKMLEDEELNGAKAYTVTKMLNDLKTNVWSELKSHKNIDIYRRGMQDNYVNALISILKPSTYQSSLGDVISDPIAIARLHLTDLRAEIKMALASAQGLSKSHLANQLSKIDAAFDTKK